jgi:hypothetical protein
MRRHLKPLSSDSNLGERRLQLDIYSPLGFAPYCINNSGVAAAWMAGFQLVVR